MLIKTKYFLMLILAINLLLPSGMGVLIGGVAINSSKIVLLLSLLLILTILYFRGKTTFSLYGADWWVTLFLFGIVFCAFMTGILYVESIGVAITLLLSSLSWCVAYFSIYFLGRLMPTSEIEINWLLKGVLWLLVVGALIGILEYILKINFYGEFARAFGMSDIGGIGGMLYRDDQVRARSAFDQSIAFGFAMVVGYILNEKLSESRRTISHYLINAVFFVALMASFSRSAIAAFFVYWFYANYSISRKFFKLGILLLLLAVLALLITQIDKVFYFDEAMNSGDGNLLVRFRDFEFAGDVLNNSPWLGLGVGVLHNSTIFESIYPDLLASYDGALDNMMLSVLVESGIVGILLYMGIIFSVFRMAGKLINEIEKRYLIGLGLVLLMASLSYDLFIFPGFGRLLLLLIAFSVTGAQFTQCYKTDRSLKAKE
jgi:hypothetical protein